VASNSERGNVDSTPSAEENVLGTLFNITVCKDVPAKHEVDGGGTQLTASHCAAARPTPDTRKTAYSNTAQAACGIARRKHVPKYAIAKFTLFTKK